MSSCGCVLAGTDACQYCANNPCQSCAKCVMHEKPKPKTNADRIRSMTAEELADFQVNIEACCRPEDLGRCIDELYSRGEGPYVPPEQCRKCWLDWLKEAQDADRE